jgi:hypothetical protein
LWGYWEPSRDLFDRMRVANWQGFRAKRGQVCDHPFVTFRMFVCKVSETKVDGKDVCTGQFKKKITLSHVYNEVINEPAITWYATIVRKALKVLIGYLTNTQCGNPVSHDTRQSDSPFLSRLFPACPYLWLPRRRWCAVSILEDHLAGVVRKRRPWHTPRERSRTVWGLATWEAKCGRTGQWWQHVQSSSVADFHSDNGGLRNQNEAERHLAGKCSCPSLNLAEGKASSSTCPG